MSAATMDEGRLTTVIVPRKWVDAAAEPDGAYHMSAAIVDYVNDVQQAGVFARHEMPAKAMQAYHADYYLAQVNNGGHSQFIGNSGELLRTITGDALAGLEAMGATAQHRILIEMAAWAAANPADAGAQDGFGIRAEPLDSLDTRFYAAEGETPIAPLAARWIASWPELRIVEDDRYASAIAEIAASNPNLGPRLVWKNVQEIRYQLTDPLQIAVAAACGAAEPQPEIKTGVGGGFIRRSKASSAWRSSWRPRTASGCASPATAAARAFTSTSSRARSRNSALARTRRTSRITSRPSRARASRR